MNDRMIFFVVGTWIALAIPSALTAQTVQLHGQIVDVLSNKPLPARLYIHSKGGTWHFAKSAVEQGSAVEYRKQRYETSVEMHTTLSGHRFVATLPAGEYTLTIERGKEYLPVTRDILVEDQDLEVTIKLRRWIDMAKMGWYSGDTHVHRPLEELPNLVLAEDLNVALPLSYWVTTAYTSPQAGNKNTGSDLRAKPIQVDPTHLIYPINTEYEIFTVGGQRHTLGAVFVLGHKRPLGQPAPPVAPIARAAREQGALLDLDKHSWPWSLMLIPVMDIDLFELANNHVWRTEFGLRTWTIDVVPEWMQIERDQDGLTEWGWIDFGFKTYYAFLNCGFRLRPTAGTASGVHPVPLGFGRVYVQVPGAFSYQKWMRGLDRGRSFVTTGPMLFVDVANRPPGATIKSRGAMTVRVQGHAESTSPLKLIEVVVNGEVAQRLHADNKRTEQGTYLCSVDTDIAVESSSWVAVRVFEDRTDKRVRFAHSSPVHIDIAGSTLRPRKAEVGYFIRRMQQEIERNREVLRPAELAEYEQALQAFEEIAKRAR